MQLFVAPREHLDSLTPLPEQEGPQSGSLQTLEMFTSKVQLANEIQERSLEEGKTGEDVTKVIGIHLHIAVTYNQCSGQHCRRSEPYSMSPLFYS